MLNIFDIKDRCYLITGASSGIGRNLSILLNEAGAKLLLTGRSIEKLNETHDMLKYKDNAVIESADLSDVKNIKDWIRNFISKHIISYFYVVYVGVRHKETSRIAGATV